MIRTLVSAVLVCAASWLGLLAGAGNVGLQRSVSIGPATLFENPLAIGLAVGAAFVTALAATMPSLSPPACSGSTMTLPRTSPETGPSVPRAARTRPPAERWGEGVPSANGSVTCSSRAVVPIRALNPPGG